MISPRLLVFFKVGIHKCNLLPNNVCCHNLFSRFVDLSVPALTNLDLEYVCGTTLGTQYIILPFHIIFFQEGIGIWFTVITSIVTGHKSVSVILGKLK